MSGSKIKALDFNKIEAYLEKCIAYRKGSVTIPNEFERIQRITKILLSTTVDNLTAIIDSIQDDTNKKNIQHYREECENYINQLDENQPNNNVDILYFLQSLVPVLKKYQEESLKLLIKPVKRAYVLLPPPLDESVDKQESKQQKNLQKKYGIQFMKKLYGLLNANPDNNEIKTLLEDVYNFLYQEGQKLRKLDSNEPVTLRQLAFSELSYEQFKEFCENFVSRLESLLESLNVLEQSTNKPSKVTFIESPKVEPSNARVETIYRPRGAIRYLYEARTTGVNAVAFINTEVAQQKLSKKQVKQNLKDIKSFFDLFDKPQYDHGSTVVSRDQIEAAVSKIQSTFNVYCGDLLPREINIHAYNLFMVLITNQSIKEITGLSRDKLFKKISKGSGFDIIIAEINQYYKDLNITPSQFLEVAKEMYRKSIKDNKGNIYKRKL